MKVSMARRSSAARSSSGPQRLGYETRRFSTVYVDVPMPVALRPRMVKYTYPSPIQKRGRVVRIPLKPLPTKYVVRRVGVRIPNVLPLVRPSYVSLSRSRLNIHSRMQLRRLLGWEYNRRRKDERKVHRRRAHAGQLESLVADRFGMVAESYRRGDSISRIADAALVSRALGG